MDAEGKSLLEKLARRSDFRVIIVSGRSISELRRLVPIRGIYYAGNHGLEIEGPGASFAHSAALGRVKTINEVSAKLSETLDCIDGVVIENKRLSLSVHYRLVKTALRSFVVMSVRRVVQDLKDIVLSYGKMVVEVRPRVDWDKGKAVRWLLNRLGDNSPVIYLGDDQTDEDAFGSLRHQITVRITPRPIPTKAKYYLPSVKAVRQLMKKLSERSD